MLAQSRSQHAAGRDSHFLFERHAENGNVMYGIRDAGADLAVAFISASSSSAKKSSRAVTRPTISSFEVLAARPTP